MKWMWKLLAICVLLIVIALFVIAATVYFVDPNKLKPIIMDEARKRTGYDVAINGTLSWSFFPSFGVRADQITLRAPDQPTPFVELKQVTMATALQTLFNRGNTWQGEIDVAAVKWLNIHVERAHVTVHWQNGVLTLNPITASLYGGSMTGTAEGSEFMTVPHWKWQLKVNDVELKPLLQDLNGADSKLKLSGVADVTLDVTTQGQSKDDMIRQLNGNSTFNVKNGVLEGIDVNFLIQSAVALFHQQPPTLPAQSNETAFGHAAGSAAIVDGVVKTDNTRLDSATFSLTTQGTIDLTNKQLDLRLRITPLQVTALKGAAVPVLIDGSFSHPSVRLDMLSLKSMIIQQEFEQVKTDVSKQIKQLPQKADQFLQRLLGQ